MIIQNVKIVFLEIIVAALLVLLIYTSLNKILDYEIFTAQLHKSPFIEKIAGFVSIAIPAVELFLVILLVSQKTRLLGLYLSFGLMLLFTGYVWLMLQYAYDLPCSCGGIISELSWGGHLIFNSLISIMILYGIVLQSNLININDNIKRII